MIQNLPSCKKDVELDYLASKNKKFDMIKVKLITYYEDDENFEEVISLKEFKDRFNSGVRHDSLDNVDRIEFIVE